MPIFSQIANLSTAAPNQEPLKKTPSWRPFEIIQDLVLQLWYDMHLVAFLGRTSSKNDGLWVCAPY